MHTSVTIPPQSSRYWFLAVIRAEQGMSLDDFEKKSLLQVGEYLRNNGILEDVIKVFIGKC